jgi:micrococcal nuclease
MRKLISLLMVVSALLAMTRYGPAMGEWIMQHSPERLGVGSGSESSAGAPRPDEKAPAWSIAIGPAEAHAAAMAGARPAGISGPVVQVVDGDTIKVRLEGQIETVRYIGITAPGSAATQLNRRLVDGSRVRLELDEQERDRVGHLLAYVYVGDTMVNAEIVAEGQAEAISATPNVRHQELLQDLDRQARLLRVGRWAAPDRRG